MYYCCWSVWWSGGSGGHFMHRRFMEGIINHVSIESKKIFPDNIEQMKKWYPAANAIEAQKQFVTIASDIMLMGSVRIGESKQCRNS